jgi:hypothetical protein
MARDRCVSFRVELASMILSAILVPMYCVGPGTYVSVYGILGARLYSVNYASHRRNGVLGLCLATPIKARRDGTASQPGFRKILQ